MLSSTSNTPSFTLLNDKELSIKGSATHGIEPKIIHDANSASEIVFENASTLLNGDFSKMGEDLLITGPDGAQVLILNYYGAVAPPLLVTLNGAILPPDLVQSLATSDAPLQYAENTETITAADPIGIVETSIGQVTVTRAWGEELLLGQGEPVYQGDILKTGDESAVGITFADDSTFSLGDGGRMVLDELIYDASTQEGSSLFSVVQGVFVFVSGEIAEGNPDAMVVRTPVATLGIRGTKVAGRAAQEGELNTITLMPDSNGSVGQITVSNSTGAITLQSAFQTTAVSSSFEAPAQAITLSGSQASALFGSVNRVLTRGDNARESRNQTDDQDSSSNRGATESQGLVSDNVDTNNNDSNNEASGVDGESLDDGFEDDDLSVDDFFDELGDEDVSEEFLDDLLSDPAGEEFFNEISAEATLETEGLELPGQDQSETPDGELIDDGILPPDDQGVTGPAAEAPPGPGSDGDFGPGPDGEFGPGPDGEFGPGPDGDFGPGTNNEFGPGPDGEFGPGPDGEFGPEPDGEFGPGPDGDSDSDKPLFEGSPEEVTVADAAWGAFESAINSGQSLDEAASQAETAAKDTAKEVFGADYDEEIFNVKFTEASEEFFGPDGEFGPTGNSESQGPGSDGEFGPSPSGDLGPGSDENFGPGPDGEFGPGPDGEFGPGPDGEFGPGPDGEFGPGPDGEFGPGPDSEFGPGPDGDFGPGPDGDFGPGPDGDFGPGPDGAPKVGQVLGGYYGEKTITTIGGGPKIGVKDGQYVIIGGDDKDSSLNEPFNPFNSNVGFTPVFETGFDSFNVFLNPEINKPKTSADEFFFSPTEDDRFIPLLTSGNLEQIVNTDSAVTGPVITGLGLLLIDAGTNSFTFTETGQVFAGVGVTNEQDNAVSSGLLIDNFKLNGTVIESFEDGTLNGVSAVGNVAVIGNSQTIAPTDGSAQAFLLAGSVGQSQMETFLGISQNLLDFDGAVSPTSGSVLAIHLDVNAGDVLTYDYVFIDRESAGGNQFVFFKDFAFSTFEENFAGKVTGTTGVDSINLDPGDNTILGLSGNDILSAGAGNDFIDGGSGNDTISGGAGDDTLVGGTGTDTLTGGSGDDLIRGSFDDDIAVFSGARADYTITGVNGSTITVEDGTSNRDGKDTLNQIKTLSFSDGSVRVGTTGNDSLSVDNSITTILGLSGNDTITGGTAADILEGGSGNDTITGNDGNDTINGGTGNDRITGLAGNDSLTGGDGADQMFGGDGFDTMSGGDGNDFMTGNGANDVMSGGDGNDIVDGNAGVDTLTGGSGDDLFGFFSFNDVVRASDGQSGLTNSNQITDFTSGDDLIEFGGFTFGFGSFRGLLESSQFFEVEDYDGTNSGASSGAHVIFDPNSLTVYQDSDPTTNGYTVVATLQSGADVVNTDIRIL